MTGYELSRNWFDWCFDNPEKISPNHTAIYFFALEHQNRLGGKEKFGFPSQMTMEALGIKKHQTYIKYFNDLIEWGFIKLIQKSTNQYSANIISINKTANTKNGKATGKALDKAFIKHVAKQTESNGQSTGQSNSSIDKQETIEQVNKEQKTIDLNQKLKFGEFQNVFLTKEEYLKAQEKYGSFLDAMIQKLSSYIKSKGDKYKDHYATFSSWVYKSVLEESQKGGHNPQKQTGVKVLESNEIPKNYGW